MSGTSRVVQPLICLVITTSDLIRHLKSHESDVKLYMLFMGMNINNFVDKNRHALGTLNDFDQL